MPDFILGIVKVVLLFIIFNNRVKNYLCQQTKTLNAIYSYIYSAAKKPAADKRRNKRQYCSFRAGRFSF
jgi:hypothetical protein